MVARQKVSFCGMPRPRIFRKVHAILENKAIRSYLADSNAYGPRLLDAKWPKFCYILLRSRPVYHSYSKTQHENPKLSNIGAPRLLWAKALKYIRFAEMGGLGNHTLMSPLMAVPRRGLTQASILACLVHLVHP